MSISEVVLAIALTTSVISAFVHPLIADTINNKSFAEHLHNVATTIFFLGAMVSIIALIAM